MNASIIVPIVSIFVLGIGGMWLASILKIPSILFLLLIGFAAGPLTGWLKPEEVFGSLFEPLISLAMVLVLFEAGLSLRRKDLKKAGPAVLKLITGGVLVTWLLTAGLAFVILKFSLPVSCLLAAILVVTGPTVIIPLLQEIRPRGPAAAVVRWEGIMNDPVGAVLAILIFQAILTQGADEAAGTMLGGFLMTLLAAPQLALAGAWGIRQFLGREKIPDYLENPLVLVTVLGLFAVTERLQPHAGLVTVTLTGIFLANQHQVNLKHLMEFKESLRVLIISTLFIVLAAHLTWDDVRHVDAGYWFFLAGLIFVVRPVSVWISTWKSPLSVRDRLFVAWMAPRGVVAAAMAAMLSEPLARRGYSDAGELTGLVFFVILMTGAVYGLSAPWLARLLRIANHRPQDVLILGALPWTLEIGQMIQEQKFNVAFPEDEPARAEAARRQGFHVIDENLLASETLEKLDPERFGHALLLHPSNETNSLAALRLSELLGKNNIYQISPEHSRLGLTGDSVDLRALQGKILFNSRLTFEVLDGLLKNGKAQFISVSRQREKTADSETVYPFLGIRGKNLHIYAEAEHVSGKGEELVCLQLIKKQESFDPSLGNKIKKIS